MLGHLEPLARAPAPATARAAAGTAASGGAAGLGGARPTLPLGAAMQTQTPPPELCERLKQAAAMRPLPGNDRTAALLAACAPRTQGAAGVAAVGGRGASSGDVPDARERVPLAATAVFTHAPDGVSLLIVLDGCKDGALYPAHIHAGHGCADAGSIGERWDHTRGDDIPDLRCNGAHASQDYTRAGTADKAWTLGGPSVSDVIGHVLVIDDPDDHTLPIACGVITAP